MKNLYNKIKFYALGHKVIVSVVLLVIILAGYWGYKKITNAGGVPRYLTAKVEKGTVIASVSGSGQVESSNELNLSARGSGQITYVGVKAGDVVKKGKTLFALDARNAGNTVKNAQTNLESAQLDLEKFEQPPNTVDVMTIKKAIADAETSKLDAAQTVKDKYRALLNTSTAVSANDTSSTQTPPTISGTYTKDKEAVITITSYNGAYFTVSSIPDGIVSGSGNISTVLPQPMGDSGLYIKFSTTSSVQPNWIITLPNKSVSTYDANYTAYQNALEDERKANDAADLSIAQNNKKLNDLYQPDSFTLRTKQLAVQQAQNSLDNAKLTLSDYYVSAPFDGTIATVTGKVGDNASGTLGVIITKQKIATISMNEVDVAKIKLGQKATLTFDAVQDLTVTGAVTGIDSVGTVSQGVVTYNVKISFDTQDDRVKPAMSVSAAIITDIKQGVLVVANGAVKSVNGISYIEILEKTKPVRIKVQTGISNDAQTEIISGIEEGEEIITRTITTTAVKTSAPSIFGNPGGNRVNRGQ